MKLSYINSFGNKGNTFVAQDITTDSLPDQANSNTTHQYLQPDYFLPSSSSESYYSRKYRGYHVVITSTNASSNECNKLNFKFQYSKISRIVSASLLSSMMLTATLDAKAHPSIETNSSFLFGNGAGEISTNIPSS